MGGSIFCFIAFVGNPRTLKNLQFQNIPHAHFEISPVLLAWSEVLKLQSESCPVTGMLAFLPRSKAVSPIGWTLSSPRAIKEDRVLSQV